MSALFVAPTAGAVERTDAAQGVLRLVSAKNHSGSSSSSGSQGTSGANGNGGSASGGNAASGTGANGDGAAASGAKGDSDTNGGQSSGLADTGVGSVVLCLALVTGLLGMGVALSCRRASGDSCRVAKVRVAGAVVTIVSLTASLALVGTQAHAAQTNASAVGLSFAGEAEFADDNSVSVPALNVTNHSAHDITITAVTVSDGLTWVSQAVGKTVTADGGSLASNWLAPTAIPASLAREVKASASQSKDLTVSVAYSYDDAYVVTWDANGGMFPSQVSSTTMKVNPGSAVSDPGVPTRVGYTFQGWNTSANGTGQSVAASGSAASRPTANATYYAQWKARTYTISYELNNGTATGANPTQYAHGVGVASLSEPQRTGWRFDGWYDSPHLYTKIGSGTSADDYLEMRIIQVGQHDGDGSGLTFQAVHAMPTALRMDTKQSNQSGYWNYDVCGWLSGGGSSAGPFWKMLPEGLSTQIMTVYKKYAHNDYYKGYSEWGRTVTGMWILGYSELYGALPSGANTAPSDGSQYAFWKYKGVTNKYPSYNALGDLHLYQTRSGGLPKPPAAYANETVYKRVWTRMDFSSTGFYMVDEYGAEGASSSNLVNAVVPAFCL